MKIAVVGGGIFGMTAALALRARKHEVRVYEEQLPHPLAESTDISKAVRIDYGADEDYTALGEQALAGWRKWNQAWAPHPLFRETGVTFLSRTPMQPGGFEYESYALLTRRGHKLERLDADAIAKRFPAWRPGAYVDGYFNPQGGWADSGAVVSALVREADERGVRFEPKRVQSVERLQTDLVVVCAGSWVPLLVPELAPVLRAVGQPVFHLKPADRSQFSATKFPVFGADISRTGFYGFPANREGIVKIANHGVGITIAPGDDRPDVTVADEAALRAMLTDTFPALVDAPIVGRRLCVYCDTADEHFWIARHPSKPNIVVATGGSGHAFKFAPVLGDLIASIALGEPHPLANKFRWRPELVAQGSEAARHHGDR
jgi:glycine/D-amino acid oxidase-like deaminating enzyme